MPFLLVRHRVKDYTKWKPAFDAHGLMREKAGSKGGYVFRGNTDPEEVVVLLEWDDIQKAKDFAASTNLHEAMEEAGVAETPQILFLEVADQPEV